MNQQAVTDFTNERQILAKEFKEHSDPFEYLLKHTHAADEAIETICTDNNLSPRIAVVAVGGYGRCELFPFSDLDLLFLLPEDVKDSELKVIEQVLNDLWSLGLTVGHSVRTIDECISQAEEDITAQTAMLESRFLMGDADLYKKYTERMEVQLNFVDFFRAKFIEQQQRHLRFQETTYALEPNIKESPGGLRDLHIVTWILKAAYLDAAKKNKEIPSLLTNYEQTKIHEDMKTLFWLRIHVHLLVNRHEDRLLFEIQESLAKELGFKADADRRASEKLMQQYYAVASSIELLNDVILQALKEHFVSVTKQKGVSIGNGFLVKGDVLDTENENFYQNDPAMLLMPFVLATEHREINKFSTTIHRAYGNLDKRIPDNFASLDEVKSSFLKILKAKKGVYHCLKEMNKLGILSKLIPPFGRIVGQLQHDLFHAYTVDQHTILAISYLRRFTKSENAHEMPLMTELMMSLEDNWRLVAALLFHDIGKGRGGDHSRIGAEEVKIFAKSYNLTPEETDYIEFLVREHLTMSRVAQKQDISDPEVIKKFAEKVVSLDRLTGLYLITVADIRATGPKVWNSWKAKLLEELFYATANFLQGKSLSKTMLVNSRREDVLKAGNFNAKEKEKLEQFWEDFDVGYFMRHSVDNILWQSKELLEHMDRKSSYVIYRPVKGLPNAYEVVVLTEDRNELFARIVSTFQSYRLSILEARIYTGKTGRVLDHFVVIDNNLNSSSEEKFEELKADLINRLDNQLPLQPPIKGRLSRHSKNFPITPEVQLRVDAGGSHYLLSVAATDRLGILATIARVFIEFKINLITARIATLGERIEDVFVIENPRLADPQFAAEFETALLKILELRPS